MELDLMQAIQSVGVPTATLFYLLTIGKGIMEKVVTAMNNQTLAFQEMTVYLKKITERMDTHE